MWEIHFKNMRNTFGKIWRNQKGSLPKCDRWPTVVKTLVLALKKTHSCQIDPLCTFLHLHAGLRKQIPCPISPFFSQVFSRITASSSGVTESEKYSWQNQRNMVHRIGEIHYQNVRKNRSIKADTIQNCQFFLSRVFSRIAASSPEMSLSLRNTAGRIREMWLLPE